MEEKVDFLSIEDTRRVVALLSALAERAGTLADRREFLAHGLCKLVDAQVWMWNLVCLKPGDPPLPFSMQSGGWTSEEQRHLMLASLVDPPTDKPAIAMLSPDHHVTRTRSQLLHDDEWFETEFHNRFRAPTGLEDFILSIHPAGVPHGYSGVGIHRAKDKGPFSPRDRCLVHLILGEVAWLHRVDAIPHGATRGGGLSTRERQVLLQLLAGASRKQVAKRLNLSEHTVDDYVKSLHRHFNVSSRGELMSRFLSGGPTLADAGESG